CSPPVCLRFFTGDSILFSYHFTRLGGSYLSLSVMGWVEMGFINSARLNEKAATGTAHHASRLVTRCPADIGALALPI
ncbi:hypothetical protein, partial [Acinetobacter baumannii]|uniref:hypothetical protein n=1 Tax=Acinetobacter baumannii TaxID=470 RepID=UPI001C077669